MKSFVSILLATLAFTLSTQITTVALGAQADRVAARHSQSMPWHGSYYNIGWGSPIALIVPPTAHMQTNWGWGVSQSTMTPIYHQFQRAYPGDSEGGANAFQATPFWPSHTSQFGVYYVRGPY
jgi:hypothetical protein